VCGGEGEKEKGLGGGEKKKRIFCAGSPG